MTVLSDQSQPSPDCWIGDTHLFTSVSPDPNRLNTSLSYTVEVVDM